MIILVVFGKIGIFGLKVVGCIKELEKFLNIVILFGCWLIIILIINIWFVCLIVYCFKWWVILLFIVCR